MSLCTSIYIDGFKRANPIPHAARAGNLLMSGAIAGLDPATGQLPSTLAEQCRYMFIHVRSILAAGGAAPENVLKMTVWAVDTSQKDALNEEWLRMFPDPAARPARHTHRAQLDGALLVMCDLVAWVP